MAALCNVSWLCAVSQRIERLKFDLSCLLSGSLFSLLCLLYSSLSLLSLLSLFRLALSLLFFSVCSFCVCNDFSLGVCGGAMVGVTVYRSLFFYLLLSLNSCFVLHPRCFSFLEVRAEKKGALVR